jgi:hypothetical protein
VARFLESIKNPVSVRRRAADQGCSSALTDDRLSDPGGGFGGAQVGVDEAGALAAAR